MKMVMHAAWYIVPCKVKPRKGLGHQVLCGVIVWKTPVIIQIQSITVMAGMS